MKITEEKITELLAAARRAKKAGLVLLVDVDLGWTMERGDCWLSNQLCAITSNYSPDGLRKFLADCYAAHGLNF